MFNYGDQSKVKCTVEVDLLFDDNTAARGSLFVTQGQRVIDLLNDDRHFLPFETDDGTAIFIGKAFIRKITPVDQSLTKTKPIPTSVGVR